MANMKDRMARARRSERAGDLAGAIAQYREALVLQEETSGVADLGLYNRIGDLYLKGGDPTSAISAFEEAADQYEAQQLYANAIALCKKILRNTPDYVAAHRRVGRLLALSGLHAEARAHYQEYAAQLAHEGDRKGALTALLELLELTGDEEARLLLAEHYLAAGKPEEGLTQLMTVWRARTERGVEADEIKKRIDVLDPDVQLSSTAVAEAAAPVHETPAPAESLAAPSLASPGATAPPEAASRVAASDDAGIETLVGELRKALHHLEGEEKLLQALPIVSQLVELQPEKVELLQRKLAYALKLGEEQVAIEAYLGLGAALEARLDSFSLRFLTSAAAEGVTTAIRVQPVTDARTAERDV
jgi:tetratricopeptide (TPR) repeat protein